MNFDPSRTRAGGGGEHAGGGVAALVIALVFIPAVALLTLIDQQVTANGHITLCTMHAQEIPVSDWCVSHS